MKRVIVLLAGLLALTTVPALADEDWQPDRDSSWYTSFFASKFPKDIPIRPTSQYAEGTYLIDGYHGYEDTLCIQKPCLQKLWYYVYTHDIEYRDPESGFLGHHEPVHCAYPVKPLNKNFATPRLYSCE